MTEMPRRPLGDSDLQVSVVGIGCNAFSRRVDADAVRGILRAARDTGVTLLDTADVYGATPGGSESLLGDALRGHADGFVIATKFGSDIGAAGLDAPRGSRAYVRHAVEGSLRRLRVDAIDLYQLHTPDHTTPIAETLAALTELVAEGKVRQIGCSNMAAWELADATWTARTTGSARFVSIQNRYSLLERSIESEVIPACETYRVGVLPYFPLEYGLLTGKYHRGAAAPAGSRAALEPDRAGWLRDADWDRIEAVTAYAGARGRTVLDVAIAGLAAQPAVSSVISGVTSADQVRANAGAVTWVPSAEDLAELDRVTGGSPVDRQRVFSAPRARR